jgi:hypothetical protein
MPGNPDPVAAPYTARSAADIIAYHKLHTPLTVADLDEVRNADLSGRYSTLRVRSLGAVYDLDTEDLSADDLSDSSDTVIDAAGNHFLRIVDLSEPTQRIVTAAGPVTVSADDVDIIVIEKTIDAATTVNLPSAAGRSKAIEIVDGKPDAATNNITIVPQSGEKIFGTVNYHAIIDSNGASLKLRPRADGTGWI